RQPQSLQQVTRPKIKPVAGVEGDGNSVLHVQRWAAAALPAAILDIVDDQGTGVKQLHDFSAGPQSFVGFVPGISGMPEKPVAEGHQLGTDPFTSPADEIFNGIK